YKDRLVHSRTEGTRTLAQALRGTRVRVLISASATGYYGPHGAEELDESASSGSDFLSGLCRAWEEAAQPAREAGVRVVHPRIGIVLHPEGGALGKMLTPFRMGVGGRLGSGEQYMSWIHRADLLSLFLFALDHDALSGPINATAPQPVTNAEFTRALAHALHRPAVMAAPGFAIKLAMGEASDILLTGQRVLPKRPLAAGFSFAHPSLDGALADLLGISKPSTG
ncbi:MAG TPA: TIGR01777 family oxidoreductase, partial [Myxococcaceae bacterium]|nr:TIGR01777 family oxidoreductase [Myxococcaceae bacterium]